MWKRKPQERERECIKCHETKPLDDFYECRRDGSVWHHRTCKECFRAGVKARRRDKGRAWGDPQPSTGDHCPQCYGMSWRRPRRGLCRCGETWAPEPAIQLDPFSRREEPRCEISK